jgi:hypothetical protein
MAFLTPLFLGALLAVAIPIVVHLVQRDRRRVVEFPSLMFLRKIPTQAVRRQAIRHWPLLAIRALAFILLALAFARPFAGGASGAAAGGGDRDVVLLLDRSLSMGYGDRWARAQAEARTIIAGLAPGDRGTLALFDTEVEFGVRSASERAALTLAVDRATPGAGATRIGAAIRAASGQIETSDLPRREIVLISDFQRSSWDRSSAMGLPPGVAFRTISVAEPSSSNTAVAGLTFERVPVAGGDRVTTTARLANWGASAAANRELLLEVDGHRVDSVRVDLGAHSVTTRTLAPFTVSGTPARVTARLEADALPADNVFVAVVLPGGRVPVVVIESSNPSPDASLYLARAIGVGVDPAFDVTVVRADRVTSAQIASAAVIVLNDTRVPTGAAARALDTAVRNGAGLLVALGDRSSWGSDDPDLLPGTLGTMVDRSGTRGGTLGFVEYSHPVFEIFSTPRSGDLSAARVFRYRLLTSPRTVLARFDDGAVALAERRVERGTVLAWSSSLDSHWNDLALKPVFVPFVLQALTHLARYEPPRPWVTVGDQAPGAKAGTGEERARASVVTATGFHEVREGDTTTVFAVNADPAESDLSSLDPADLDAAVRGAGGETDLAARRELTGAEQERRQSVWWYLLAVGLLLLVLDGIVASRLPRLA